MCGIAGSWQSDWNVEDALAAIAHRGPDFRGIAYAGKDNEVVHGHVRLSILDPTPRSHQPFKYRGLTLSYVGECWNYQELRRSLEHELFYEFETTGDTEVVAAALWEWGPEALKRMEGQFAFAWTTPEGSTFLARDRYGEVPLYVIESRDLLGAGGVRWASERKAFGPEEAAAAVAIPEGTVWSVDAWKPQRYYPVTEASYSRANAEPDAEGVLRRLERSVERRLQSDVPVCTLISGGIDSSLILALAQRHQPDLVAYTIVFDEESDDLREARYVAEEFGVELREVHVPQPDEALLREAIYAIEITMKAQIEIALHCLPLAERIYADGYRVVLSGEGADELFGGYGMLARKSKGDWTGARLEGVMKMARGNFVRINKAFMAHGVEARTPYMDRELVEGVLPLSRDECPEQKKLLRAAAEGILPERTRTRHKVSFQSGSGMRDYQEAALAGKQQVRYNDVARELFGGLPKG